MQNERLQELIDARLNGRLSRRQLVQRLVAMGVSLPVMASVLAACADDDGDDAADDETDDTADDAEEDEETATEDEEEDAEEEDGDAAEDEETEGEDGEASQDFSGQTLIVTSYGGAWEELMRDEIIPTFEEQTGASVELAVGLATDWFAEMRAAGVDNPPFDVIIANEADVSLVRPEGHFAELSEEEIPNLANIHEDLRRDDDVGVYSMFGPLGIAYMPERVEEPPTSWTDLAEYDGPVGIYTAGNSATPQFVMLMAEIQTGDYMNWEAGFDWIAENLDDFRQEDFSGGMETLLTQGEVDMGILHIPAVSRLQSQGVEIEWVAPEEGIFMWEQNINVAQGTEVRDLANAFVNYWLGEDVQTAFMEDFWYTPANVNVEVPEDMEDEIPITTDEVDQIVQFDWEWWHDGPADEMVARWNREITN